jgi:large subunit ribosomal protein L21
MYAVVEAGGRQYQLTSGRYIDVDLVAGEPQSEFVFDRVLMIVDGDKSMVGKPVVDGAKVTGKIISHGKGQKLVVYKYRPKKGTRKRTGHRQGFTRIYIDSIKVNDKVLSEVKDQGRPQPKAAAAEKTEAPKAEKAAKAEKAPAKAAPKKAAEKAAEPKKAAPKKTTKKEQ